MIRVEELESELEAKTAQLVMTGQGGDDSTAEMSRMSSQIEAFKEERQYL